MIYEQVAHPDPVRQGDIFINIPRVEFSLGRVALALDDETQAGEWRSVIEYAKSEPLTALVAVEPVTAIVITQDCDASREEYISLCVIDDFLKSISQEGKEPRDAGKWSSLILKTVRQNAKFFYLPACREIGFSSPQSASFLDVLRVKLSDLLDIRDFRVARLNKVANEHFRERLGYFFSRYSFNEWYPLTKEQLQAYQSNCPELVQPYEWQQ